MAKSKKASSSSKNQSPVVAVEKSSLDLSRAKEEMLTGPLTGNAHTIGLYTQNAFGNTSFEDLIYVLDGKCCDVNHGDLSEPAAMLMAQAVSLNAIYSEMARLAALNMGQSLMVTEACLRLALKAQNQCQTTLKTLGELKNPRSLAFVQQANISNGPQQVNNGIPAGAPHRAGEFENRSNELLGASHGERMESGTTSQASGANSAMAAMGTIDRAAK